MNITFQRWIKNKTKQKKKQLCHIDASCSSMTLREKKTYKHGSRCGLHRNTDELA